MPKVTVLKVGKPINIKNRMSVSLPIHDVPQIKGSMKPIYVADLVLRNNGLFKGYTILKDKYRKSGIDVAGYKIKKYMNENNYCNIVIVHPPFIYHLNRLIGRIFGSGRIYG